MAKISSTPKSVGSATASSNPITQNTLRSMISGLLAVGVAPEDAFAAFPNASICDLVDLVFEFVLNNSDLVKTLYNIAESDPQINLHDFAEMLTRNGRNLHPISVALQADTVGKAICMASAMGVEKQLVCAIRLNNTPTGHSSLGLFFCRRAKPIPDIWNGKLILPNLTVSRSRTIICNEMEILGDLIVSTDHNSCILSLPNLLKIGGDLEAVGSVNTCVKLYLPIVIEVSGQVRATSANLSMPMLAQIGGSLKLEDTTLALPLLVEVSGSLLIKKCNTPSLPALAKIGGSLSIYGCDKPSLPSLVRIAMYLDLADSPGIVLSTLTCIGGTLFASYAKNLVLPALKHLGGDLDIGSASHVSFGDLTRINGSLIATNSDPFWAMYAKNNYPNHIRFPKLVAIDGQLVGSHLSGLDLPVLANVGNNPYL